MHWLNFKNWKEFSFTDGPITRGGGGGGGGGLIAGFDGIWRYVNQQQVCWYHI